MMPIVSCSIPDNFAPRVNDYNQSLERAENNNILLNILRSSEDRPLHFTGFSLIRGSMSTALGTATQANVTLGGDNNTARLFAIGPSLSVANSPSFDLAVLDTQEFANGILSPLSLSQVERYYRQTGDIRDFLYRFVEMIEISADGEPLPFDSASSDPDQDGTEYFSCYVGLSQQITLTISTNTRTSEIINTSVDKLGSIKDIEEMMKIGYFLIQDEKSGKVSVRKRETGVDFTSYAVNNDVPDQHKEKAKAAAALLRSLNYGDAKDAKSRSNVRTLYEQGSSELRFAPWKADGNYYFTFLRELDNGLIKDYHVRVYPEGMCENPGSETSKQFVRVIDGLLGKFFTLRLYLRSPESMFRFLGHALAAERAGSELPSDIGNMITVERSPTGSDGCDGAAFVACVSYGGVQYAVPAGDRATARTIMVLHQVTMLRKKRSEEPVTTAVQVVGTGRPALP